MQSPNAGSISTENGAKDVVFDLRLPHLNTSGTSDKSHTDEPLLSGFYGIVQFEEWKEFDSLMIETIAATAQIPSDFRERAREEFAGCFRKVNKVYPNSNQNALHPVQSRAPRPSEVCYAVTPLYKYGDIRRHYDNCTSVGAMENIFFAVLELLEGLYSSQYNFEFTTKKFPLLGIPLVPKKRSPTADKSLCSVTMNRCDAPPICTVELKGPTVRFAQYVFDFCQSTDSSGAQEKVSQGCVHEESSKRVCLYLNHLFNTLDVLETDKNKKASSSDVNRGIAKRVAQTLVQAMTSASGCGFLFNYECGIAFEVVHDKNISGRVVVRTSSLFCCGNQMGSVSAMLTTANYAVKKLFEHKAPTDGIGKCVKMVVDNSKRRGSREKGGSRTSSSGAKINGTDGLSHSSAGSSSAEGRNRRPLSGELDSFHNVARKCNQTSLIDTETLEFSATESDMSDVTEEIAVDDVDNMLVDILKAQRQVLGSGGSGMVLSSEWNGMEVALKIWNGDEESGLAELRREVQNYKYFGMYATSLLGTAIPELRLAIDTTNKDGPLNATIALVIDYIGEELSRDAQGNLCLGSTFIRKIKPADEHEVHAAASKSLGLLHESHVLHRDICLRNLRVEAIQIDGNEKVSWKVWWIDFGRATVGSVSKWERDSEQRKCDSLFRH